MPYTRNPPWQDGPGLTLISAEKLEHIESGIQAAAATADSVATQAINSQVGTSYTLQASDAGRVVKMTNAQSITLTVPNTVFTAGQRVDVLVAGAGLVSAVAGAGMTLHGTPSLTARAQWSMFSVLFLSASEAVVVGDLA